MKTTGIIFTAVASVLIVWAIAAEIIADYEYSRDVSSYWNLADKASTLDLKSQYLDRFVGRLDELHLSGNNAIWFKTPDNSIEQNMDALKSLQSRMHEIKGMDVTSFQYQQAIQQITAQEQGEAKNLLATIEGAWYLQEHPLLWDWLDFSKWIAMLVILGAGGILILIEE